MKLKEWNNYLTSKLEDQIDDFLEEHGYEYVYPNPLTSEADQLKQIRNTMLDKLLYKEWDIDRGLTLLLNLLPQHLKAEDWLQVKNELTHVEENTLNYFNSINKEKKISNKGKLQQTSEILGISVQTCQHSKQLLFHLIETKNYQDAFDLSVLLCTLFQNLIVGWIGVAKCYDYLGENFKAIEAYKIVQKLFPNDPISGIFCAWSYFCIGNPVRAKEQLSWAKNILENNPEVEKVWSPLIKEIEKKLSNE
jgi:tetratricopeptide (TPR) repeat protein